MPCRLAQAACVEHVHMDDVSPLLIDEVTGAHGAYLRGPQAMIAFLSHLDLDVADEVNLISSNIVCELDIAALTKILSSSYIRP